jgi:hypothetical protein
MTRAPIHPPGPTKEKAWKLWHSVLTMLTAGATASGRLSHELIANVKAKYSYRSDKAILGGVNSNWPKYFLSPIPTKI